MTDIKLEVRESEMAVQERVRPDYRMPGKPVQQKAEKVVLSDNIQKFDRKIHTKNPYDYNTIALRKQVQPTTPTQESMVADPTYTSIGKFLGVDTRHEWSMYYDKVHAIVEWAKKKVGKGDQATLMRWISEQQRKVPSFGARRIDDLYIYSQLSKK